MLTADPANTYLPSPCPAQPTQALVVCGSTVERLGAGASTDSGELRRLSRLARPGWCLTLTLGHSLHSTTVSDMSTVTDPASDSN